MNPESIDTLAQELHAMFCGPGRWEHAMPASQELYRKAVRAVLESQHLTNLATGAELLRFNLVEVTDRYQDAKRIIDAIADALHPHWGCKTGNGYHADQLAIRITALGEARAGWEARAEKAEACMFELKAQMAAAEKERDEQRARADRADACIEELMRQKTELMKLYLAGKTHIAALENVAEAARLLYGVAQTDDIGRQYVAVSWSTWEALRAALDAAQPKDPVVETWLDIDSVTDSGQPGSSQEGGTQRDQCNDVTVSGESVPAGPLESCSVENQRAPIVAMPQPDQPGCSSPIDDPSLDGTDGAHPAWWRGHDSASEAWDKRLGQALAETAQLRADVTTLSRTLIDYGVCADDGDLHEIIQRGQGRKQEPVKKLGWRCPKCSGSHINGDNGPNCPHWPQGDPTNPGQARAQAVARGDKGEMLGGLKERRYAEVFDEQSEKTVAWGEKESP